MVDDITVEAPADMRADEACWVTVYLDDADEPIARYRPPGKLEVDTRRLDDGEHTLRVEARGDADGAVGVREIPFRVRNGPAIAVDGLRAGELVRGDMSVMIHAFSGAEREDWEPARAESPTPIPTWVWILAIVIFAWAMFYVLSFWFPSADFADAPTWNAPSVSAE